LGDAGNTKYLVVLYYTVTIFRKVYKLNLIHLQEYNTLGEKMALQLRLNEIVELFQLAKDWTINGDGIATTMTIGTRDYDLWMGPYKPINGQRESDNFQLGISTGGVDQLYEIAYSEKLREIYLHAIETGKDPEKAAAADIRAFLAQNRKPK
jgi:hypothetical protein